jgi:hypothetical protein
MNQIPTQEKQIQSSSSIRKTNSVQLIYIFKKVGLINQTPTREVGLMDQAPTTKSSPYTRKTKSLQLIYIFKTVGLMNQAPTDITGKVSYYPFFFLSLLFIFLLFPEFQAK